MRHRYFIAVLAVAVASVGTALIYPWIEPSISLLFFPAVVIPAMYGGYGPSLLATILSTLSLAYWFVPPRYSFNIGIDDAVRLAVFVVVAVATAWVSSARRRAETAQQRSVQDLESAIATLRKVSGWPVLIGANTTASIEHLLRHAANVVGSKNAIVGWESEDEPWLYVADPMRTEEVVTKHAPSDLEALAAKRYDPTSLVSAAFHTEHLSGRVFFAGVDALTPDLSAAVEVVAREVGNSLDQLYVAERLRELAVREDRLRLSRDLHDGVLQALTGIRLELQAIATDKELSAPTHDRLLAIERALAIEQRELRLFIDELKPAATAPLHSGPIARRLEDMCARLSAEWKTPITLRIAPPELSLPETVDHAVRLMVHEAIVNALKHAHPSRVAITIDTSEAELHVSIADDGRGFPFRGRLDHERLIAANAGPVSLRERVTALDGRLSIESTAAGSRVEFVVPVTTQQA
jgi:signal transduction histidine kinase